MVQHDWEGIRAGLRVGSNLRAWSRDKGYTAAAFHIQDISPSAVIVSSSSLAKPRSVAKSEFTKIARVWPAYCAGKLSRAEMGEISQNTSYIFGILKFIEDDQGSPRASK
jgi:hypothetical protein